MRWLYYQLYIRHITKKENDWLLVKRATGIVLLLELVAMAIACNTFMASY